jgi:hypothetical protein
MQQLEPSPHLNFSDMRLKSACVQQLTTLFVRFHGHLKVKYCNTLSQVQSGGVASSGSVLDSQPFMAGGGEGCRSLLLKAAGQVVALRNDLRTFYVRHILQQLLHM